MEEKLQALKLKKKQLKECLNDFESNELFYDTSEEG